MTEGTIVAALTTMAFVMVGIFQFLKGYVASSNKEYLELRTKYETLQSKMIETETNNLIWKNRAIIERNRNKELQSRLNNCNEAVTATLTRIPPEIDDTYFPES